MPPTPTPTPMPTPMPAAWRALQLHDRALERALVRLLWDAIADQAGHDSSCAEYDLLQLCEAWRALGLGAHWPGWRKADRMLARHERRMGAR